MISPPNRGSINGQALQEHFHDPFLTESVNFMPENIGTDVWDMCYYLFGLNREFIRGFEHVVDFHLTDIDFPGDKTGDKKEKAELREWLMDGVKIFDFFKKVGLEYGCYGNSLPTPNIPFDRFLIDTRHGEYRNWTIQTCAKLGRVKFLHQEGMYEVVDPLESDKAVSKRKRIKLPFRDRVANDPNRLSFDTLNIRDVILNVAPMGGAKRVIRRFHPEFIRPLETGDPFYASTVPIDFLTASAKQMDFVLDKNHVRHFMAPTINGIRNNAFGIPETLLNFRNIYHLQVLRRTDEAIGQDYVLPFRVMTPKVDGAGGQMIDPNMAMWRSEMAHLIKERRANPYAMHALPFPVVAQDLFGTGKQFVPAESMQWHTDNLYHAMNVPVNLYKGTMEQEMVPVNLRLFASGWSFLYRGFNDILKWVVEWYCRMRREDPPDVRLTPSRIADDMERRQFLVQLVSAGELSRKTAYKSFDIDDPVKEKKDRMEEDIEIARNQQKVESEFQQEQELGALAQQDQQQSSGGGGGQSGTYGGAPSGVPVTPIQRQGQVQEKAQEWLGMSVGDRMRDMANVRNTDPTLYALAMQEKKKMERQGESQGRQQVQQQAQKGGGPQQ